VDVELPTGQPAIFPYVWENNKNNLDDSSTSFISLYHVSNKTQRR